MHREWFIGELVTYNKEIDQWTIYFKEDDYTDYVIFPDDNIMIQYGIYQCICSLVASSMDRIVVCFLIYTQNCKHAV